MKTKLVLSIISILVYSSLYSQQRITGNVTDKDGRALMGASIRSLVSGFETTTVANGAFSLTSTSDLDTIVVSFIGYLSHQIAVNNRSTTPIHIFLTADSSAIEEVVVSTGYYTIPKERATGAFTHVDNTLITRSVSSNILERLEGLVNSVQFVQPQSSSADGIRIRGLSTIESDTRPLIVVDNFPYEGDINTLNPNDIESITILRDAAAASIWGARAGNGVVVVNTKHGAYNQPTKIDISSSINIIGKPDLFFNQNYLPSPVVMEIQKEMFDRGFYTEQDHTYIPDYVELLIKYRDNGISKSDFERREAYLKQSDLRRDVTKYLLQPATHRQYSVNIRGGGAAYRYALSAGHNNNESNVKGNLDKRLNFSLQNTFEVQPGFEVSGALWYSQLYGQDNGISYGDLGLFRTNGNYIYNALRNEDGTAAATFSQFRLAYRERAEELGLLDWMYRPLDELELADNTNQSEELRANVGIRNKLATYMSTNLSYQYTAGGARNRQFHPQESFYVRNLVNRFTQDNGTKIIPIGGILELGAPSSSHTHSGRAQLDYLRDFNMGHQLAVIAGAEARQREVQTQPDVRLYNYSNELWTGVANFNYQNFYQTRPNGSAYLPRSSTISPTRRISRDLSYYGNASFNYLQRYVFSGSMRWDGSNLLGVKANQRGTVLWSLGGSWEITKERFFKHSPMHYLRVRTTYGSAGNIDKSQSHYPTISLGTNSITDLPQATLQHPGNPSLRWEQVNTFNIGIDWGFLSNRLRGSVEYYNKHAKHLLGDNLMDPATGVGGNYKVNYANLRTQGWDIELISDIMTGHFQWNTTVLFNYTRNVVTSINIPEPANINELLVNTRIIKKHQSADMMYAHHWYGLNPYNGFPAVFLNGELSTDYSTYYSGLTAENLKVAGVTIPPYFGSIRNTFAWRRVELGFVITYKGGHVFRRKSISSGQEYVSNNPVYHTDYFQRWQKPGDEKFTDVPAWSPSYGSYERDYLYQFSEALITRGDVIRLQDVIVSYALENRTATLIPRKYNIRLFLSARNLGLLWKQTEKNLDPDFYNAAYVTPKSIAFGVGLGF